MRHLIAKARIVGWVLPLLAGAVVTLDAQTPLAPPVGACLSAEQRAVNAAYYAMTRPTSRDDEMPFFDPEYFVGTWDVLSRVVESPLGSGGESAGRVTFTSVKGCDYVGELKGEDPEGKAFTRRITVSYDPGARHLRWIEVDSRGYTLDFSGGVGGELGGLFQHHFDETPTVSVGGRRLRLTGVSQMSSPAFFRADLRIAIDGAAPQTFGRTTYEKVLE